MWPSIGIFASIGICLTYIWTHVTDLGLICAFDTAFVTSIVSLFTAVLSGDDLLILIHPIQIRFILTVL